MCSGKKSKISIQNISVLTFGMIFAAKHLTFMFPGHKLNFCLKWWRRVQMDPNESPKIKKKPFWTIQAPSWRLIGWACRVWLFQSKMSHFWADPSHREWTQKSKSSIDLLTQWITEENLLVVFNFHHTKKFNDCDEIHRNLPVVRPEGFSQVCLLMDSDAVQGSVWVLSPSQASGEGAGQ